MEETVKLISANSRLVELVIKKIINEGVASLRGWSENQTQDRVDAITIAENVLIEGVALRISQMSDTLYMISPTIGKPKQDQYEEIAAP